MPSRNPFALFASQRTGKLRKRDGNIKSYFFGLMLIGIVLLAGCASQQKTENKVTSETTCQPNWQCKDWSSCLRTGKLTGIQNRTCIDLNNCNITQNMSTESQNCEMTPTATIEPSQMILTLSDFPSGKNFTLKERGDRLKSDVDIKALQLGWQKGYRVAYWVFDSNQVATTRVDQLISAYPLENISKALNLDRNSSSTLQVIEDLPNPNIGEESKAYRISLKEYYASPPYAVYYRIIFYKLNVLETLQMQGTVIDYEFLKDLAREAEGRIV